MTETVGLLDSIYADFESGDASFAWLLCDRHDQDAIALTVVDGDVATGLTYGRLRRDSSRLANAFAELGVQPGDRVASLVRKGPELVTAMLAIWRLGAVYVPLFTAFAAPAIHYRLRAAGAALVVTDRDQRDKLSAPDGGSVPWRAIVVGGRGLPGDLVYDEVIALGGDGAVAPFVQGASGPVVHIFTSGTTGLPKGVIHPLRYAANWVSYLLFGLGVVEQDVFWCAADPGWAYGLYAGIIAPLAQGSGTILQVGGFDPAATWALIERLGVTNFAAAPTVYRALRNTHGHTAGSSTLRRLSSAGEPLTPEVNEWASTELDLNVHDHFGQTEVGMILANHHHPTFEREVVAGSMGQALPGWSVVVLAEDSSTVLEPGIVGRIAIDVNRSPMMTFVNYQDVTKTAARFTPDRKYYLLGDLGNVDERGNFRFSSRDDDVIIMAGYRIGPFEVESVICQHHAVVECAVVGAPDRARGEVLEAFVVLRSDAVEGPELTKEIQTLVKTRFAAHAFPRTVHVVDQLPKTPSGKIQRFILRDQRRAELGIQVDA